MWLQNVSPPLESLGTWNDGAMNRPFEVDPVEYPFNDHWLPYRDGQIHYVDEGAGPPVLLVHGNPTWSYIYGEDRLASTTRSPIPTTSGVLS